jgi:hypothetical protein
VHFLESCCELLGKAGCPLRGKTFVPRLKNAAATDHS